MSERERDDGGPGDRLTVEVRQDGHDPGLRVAGEIDVFTAPSLADGLSQIMAMPGERAVIDLEGVTFIDSTGLRVLIEADQRMRDAEGVLVLSRPSRAVVRLLELTALVDWLTVEPSIVPGA